MSNPKLWPESKQIAWVSAEPSRVQFIHHPSEAVQIAVVKQHEFSIQFIKNPSEKVQLAAVQLDGEDVIPDFVGILINPRYINGASETVQRARLLRKASVVRLIDNQCEAVQEYIIENCPECIQFIKNPSPRIQMMLELHA